MARVKGGNVAKNRRRKVLKAAKGYFGSKHRLFKTAQEQTFHSMKYAYRDRKQNKRNFRKLWITRINAACRLNDISYSKFINGLNKADIKINRKMLAEIAINDEKAFTSLVDLAKKALDGKDAIKKDVKEEKKEVKESKQTKKEEKKDYKTLTVTELKELAKEKGIAGISSMKKDELIAALEK